MHNQAVGAWFEKVFAQRAAFQGLLCVRNGQECRFVGKGRMLPIKSNLDWTLIAAGGRVFFADTKSYIGSYFTFSQLSAAQLRRAELYTQFNVSAGFVVYFRAIEEIVWFDFESIRRKGPGCRYEPADGVLLGKLADFDLRKISRRV